MGGSSDSSAGRQRPYGRARRVRTAVERRTRTGQQFYFSPTLSGEDGRKGIRSTNDPRTENVSSPANTPFYPLESHPQSSCDATAPSLAQSYVHIPARPLGSCRSRIQDIHDGFLFLRHEAASNPVSSPEDPYPRSRRNPHPLNVSAAQLRCFQRGRLAWTKLWRSSRREKVEERGSHRGSGAERTEYDVSCLQATVCRSFSQKGMLGYSASAARTDHFRSHRGIPWSSSPPPCPNTQIRS